MRNMADKLDPLTFLPALAAELTSLRMLYETLRRRLSGCHASPQDVCDDVLQRLDRRDADAERKAALLTELSRISGKTEEDLAAWARESAAIRRGLRDQAKREQ